MEFRTEITVKSSLHSLTYKSEVITVGSCFADIIGKDLYTNKFKVVANPLGIIYNPISLFRSLLPLEFKEDDVVNRDGRWFYLHGHSTVSGESFDSIIENIQAKSKELQTSLTTASHLIITLGTAWIYEFIKTKEVVANCHKLPSNLFFKRLLSTTEIIQSFEIFYQKLQQINPQVRIWFTVSPVRHLKDTLTLNSVSKSTLRLVCHELETTYPDVTYFPAYELLIDDLRDYRYYADDLLHPTAFASKYILQKFYGHMVDESTSLTIKLVQEVNSALSHKPFQPESFAHQQFLKQTLVKVQLLSQKVDMKAEINAIESQLIGLL